MSSSPKSGRISTVRGLSADDFSTLSIGMDEKRNKQVLVRQFNPEIFEDAAHQKQFRAELAKVAKVQFDGVLKIRSLGGSTAGPRMVIGGTDGGTLREALDSSSVNRKGLFAQLSKLAAELDQLHEQGFVHGDIRAETIFFDRSGDLRLNEFATQYAICGWSDQSHHVPPEHVGPLFRPESVAPEIRFGGSATPRSDQYSLALVLLECCCGIRPSDGKTAEELADGTQLTGEKKNSLQRIKPVVVQALSKEPVQRFADCRSLTSAIGRLFSRGGADRILIAAAALLLLILPLGSYFGSNGHFASKKAAHIEAKKGELNEEIAGVFDIKVAGVSNQRVDSRITRLDPSKTTLVTRYRGLVMDTDAGTLRKLTLDTIASLPTRSRVSSETYTLGKLTKADDPGVFIFSDTGFEAQGRASDLNWQLQLRFPQLDRSLRLQYELTVRDGSGKSLAKVESDTIGGGASSLQLSGTIRPTSSPWKLGDSVSITLNLLDGSKRTEWWSSGRLRVGTINWKTEVVKLNAKTVQMMGFQYPTKVDLVPGDAYRISATGKIQPWSNGVCGLLRIPNGTQVGPAGVKVNPAPKTASTFLSVSANRSHNTGCLLMRVGQRKGDPKTDWDSPTNDRLYRAGFDDRGKLYLSINSIEKTKGAFAGSNYWEEGGAFDITISKLIAKFPPGTTPTIERSVKQKLE